MLRGLLVQNLARLSCQLRIEGAVSGAATGSGTSLNTAVDQISAQSPIKNAWTACRQLSTSRFPLTDTISVTFYDEKDGSEKTVAVPVGENLLEAAHHNEIDLEGACEGSLACSTCHVIVLDPDLFAKIPEPEDDENDMLDLAYGLTETSRLGCQVIAAKELDGMKVRIPSATRNFAVDGYVPKPH